MKRQQTTQVENMVSRRLLTGRVKRIVAFLSAFVLLTTMNSLKFDADTLERIATCGLVEHVHSETCYDDGGALTCGLEAHVHTDACYQQRPTAENTVATRIDPFIPLNTQVNLASDLSNDDDGQADAALLAADEEVIAESEMVDAPVPETELDLHTTGLAAAEDDNGLSLDADLEAVAQESELVDVAVEEELEIEDAVDEAANEPVAEETVEEQANAEETADEETNIIEETAEDTPAAEVVEDEYTYEIGAQTQVLLSAILRDAGVVTGELLGVGTTGNDGALISVDIDEEGRYVIAPLTSFDRANLLVTDADGEYNIALRNAVVAAKADETAEVAEGNETVETTDEVEANETEFVEVSDEAEANETEFVEVSDESEANETESVEAKDEAVEGTDEVETDKTEIVEAKDEAEADETEAIEGTDEVEAKETEAVEAKDEAEANETETVEGTDEVEVDEPEADETEAIEGTDEAEITSEPEAISDEAATVENDNVTIVPIGDTSLSTSLEVRYAENEDKQGVVDYLNALLEGGRRSRKLMAANRSAEVRTDRYSDYAVFDISLLDDGVEQSETGDVGVVIRPRSVNIYENLPENARVTGVDYVLYHIHGDSVETLPANVDCDTDGTLLSVDFTTPNFSSFVLKYTVDFEYTDSVTGEKIAWSWKGRGSYPIADIMAQIGVEGEISDVSLECVEGEQVSEALYIEQKEDGWYLTSDCAFDEVYELTVVINDIPHVLVVTDAQSELTDIATVTTHLTQTENLQRGQIVTASIHFDINSKLDQAKANAPWVYDLSTVIGTDKVFSELVAGQTGNFMRGTDIMGTYEVSQDGRSLIITPTADVLNDPDITEIEGTFNIKIVLNEEHHLDETSSSFIFPGGTDSTTIHYIPKTLTASKHVGAASDAIDKEGTTENPTMVTVVDLGDGTYKLYYRIEFSTSTKPYNLSIADQLTGGQSLVQDSVRLGIVAEGGTGWGPSDLGDNLSTAETGFTLDVDAAFNGGSPCNRILGPNTSYFVTYEAIIDAGDIASQSGDNNESVTFNVQNNKATFSYDNTTPYDVETHITPKFEREIKHHYKIAGTSRGMSPEYYNDTVPVVKDRDGKYYIWFQTRAMPNAPSTELKMTDSYTGITPDFSSLKIYIGNPEWVIDNSNNALSSYITQSNGTFTVDVLALMKGHANDKIGNGPATLGDYLVTINGQEAVKADTKVKIKYRAEVPELDQQVSNSAKWDWQYEDVTDNIKPTPSKGETDYGIAKEASVNNQAVESSHAETPGTQVEYSLTVCNQYANGEYASMAGVTVTDKIDNYITGLPDQIEIYNKAGDRITTIRKNETLNEDGFSVNWGTFKFGQGDFWSSGQELFSVTFPEADDTHDWVDEYTICYTVTIADQVDFSYPTNQMYGWMTRYNYGLINQKQATFTTNVNFPYPEIKKTFIQWDDVNNTATWNVHVSVPEGLTLEDGAKICDINAMGSTNAYSITDDTLTIQSMTVTSGNVSAYIGSAENAQVNQYALDVAAGTFTFPKGLNTSFDFRVVTRVPRTMKALTEYHATNTGRIDLAGQDFDSTATADYYNSDYSFEKTGFYNPSNGTTTWTVVLNKDQLLLNPEDDYEPIFYDDLPDGMVLNGNITLTLESGGAKNSYGTPMYYVGPISLSSGSNDHIGPINLVRALGGPATKVGEQLPTGLSGMKYTITYTTKFTDEKLAQMNTTIGNYDFTNHAEVRKTESGSAEKTAEDTIEYKYTDLVKKVDVSEEITSMLKYEVDINANRKTINAGNWVTLSDRINTDVTLIPATVQVYEAKNDGYGNWSIDTTTPVTSDSTKCIVSYADDTRRLEISVPDGKWYRVCFSVLPNAGDVAHDYVNTVNLSGTHFSQTETVTKKHTATTSGTMTVLTNAVTIQKVDKYNITKKLAGAQFDFYRCVVDPGTGEIIGATKIGTGTTGSNGQLRLSGTQGGVVYYWQETQAPQDYQIASSVPHYFTVYQELAERNRITVRWGNLSTDTQNALKAAFPEDTLLNSVTDDYRIIIAAQGPNPADEVQVREYHDNHYFYLTGDAAAALKSEVNSINRQEAYDIDDLVTNYYNGSITVASVTGGYTWQVENIKDEVTTKQLSFTKTMTGRAMSEGEFTFYLYNTTNPRDTYWVQTVTNPAAPAGEEKTISFDKLSYTVPGTYTYRIYEKKGEDLKVTYDEAVFDVTITVTRNSSTGKLEASEPVITKTPKGGTAESAQAIAFTNVYESVGELLLTGTKTLTGRDMLAREFNFVVKEGDDTVSRGTNKMAANGQPGEITFTPIQYNSAGNHTYVITEDTTNLPENVTAPTPAQSFTINVSVTDDGQGHLTPTITGTPEPIAFVNTFTATGSLVLEAQKVLYGGTLTDGLFSFTLTGNGVNQTKGNAEDGSVTFDEITYDQNDVGQTFTYTVKEADPQSDVYTYDQSEYLVTVAVIADPDNPTHLTTQKTIIKVKDAEGNAISEDAEIEYNGIVFENTYNPDSLVITKTFGGDVSAEDMTAEMQQAITFTVSGGDLTAAINKTLNDFTLEEGVFTLTLTEENGIHSGQTYTVTESATDPTGYTHTTTYQVNSGAVNTGSVASVPVTGKVGRAAFTNTYIGEKVNVPVNKAWLLQNGETTWPEDVAEITVKLMRKENAEDAPVEVEGKTLTLTASNQSGTFEDLPKYKFGENQAYIYTVEEVGIQGFTSAVTGDQTNGYTITNTENDSLTLKVKKVWNDTDVEYMRPSSITVQLYSSEDSFAEPISGEDLVLNAGNSWQGEWTKLDPQYTYQAQEVEANGYTVSYSPADGIYTVTGGVNTTNDTVTITNTRGTTPSNDSLEIKKAWVDGSGEAIGDTSAMPSVTFTLDRTATEDSGSSSGNALNAVLLIADSWSHFESFAGSGSTEGITVLQSTKIADTGEAQYTYNKVLTGDCAATQPNTEAYEWMGTYAKTLSVTSVGNKYTANTGSISTSTVYLVIWVTNGNYDKVVAGHISELAASITSAGMNSDTNTYPMTLTLSYPNWYAKVTGLDKDHNTYTLTETVPEDSQFVSFTVNGGTPVTTNPATLSNVGVVVAKNRSTTGALKLKKQVTVNNHSTITHLADGAYVFSIVGPASAAQADQVTKYVRVMVQSGKATTYKVAETLPENWNNVTESHPVDANGWVVISDLPEGDYTVTETEVAGMTTKVSGGKESKNNEEASSITVTVAAGVDAPADASAAATTFTNDKNVEDITVKKKVIDGNDSLRPYEPLWATSEKQSNDSADHDIGDDVVYVVYGTVPEDIADFEKYTYQFEDVMTNLTFDPASIYVLAHVRHQDDEDGIMYDVTNWFNKPSTAGSSLTVTANGTNGIRSINSGVRVNNYSRGTAAEDAGKYPNLPPNTSGNATESIDPDEITFFELRYVAKLGENANIGATGNPNSVRINHSTNVDGTGEGHTGWDVNKVFTYKLEINKEDFDHNPLPGATFTLEKYSKTNDQWKSVAEKTPASAERTKFIWEGIDDGIYKLTETAPAGYKGIGEILFQISATHDFDSADPQLTNLFVVEKRIDENGDFADKRDERKYFDYANTTTGEVNLNGGTIVANIPNVRKVDVPVTKEWAGAANLSRAQGVTYQISRSIDVTENSTTVTVQDKAWNDEVAHKVRITKASQPDGTIDYMFVEYDANAADPWHYVWKDLPESGSFEYTTAGGEKKVAKGSFRYVVEEIEFEYGGQTFTVSNSNGVRTVTSTAQGPHGWTVTKGKGKFTNTQEPTTATVTKSWTGPIEEDKIESVTYELRRKVLEEGDEKEYQVETITVIANEPAGEHQVVKGDDWSYTWRNLPKYVLQSSYNEETEESLYYWGECTYIVKETGFTYDGVEYVINNDTVLKVTGVDAKDKPTTEPVSYWTMTQSDTAITNALAPISLKVIKVEKGTPTRLPNAEFQLTRSDNGTYKVFENEQFGLNAETNKHTGPFSVGNTGEITITNLLPGDYKLSETKAPAGYIITTGEIDFTINVDGTVTVTGRTADGNGNITYTDTDNMVTFAQKTASAAASVTVQNEPGVALPATGGMGTGVVYGAGAALVLLAVLGMILTRRKRTDGEGIR